MNEELHVIQLLPSGCQERFAIIAIDPEERTARLVRPVAGKDFLKSRQAAHQMRRRLEKSSDSPQE